MSNEELGQELDRWQLIARDLIHELAVFYGGELPEFEYGVYEELKAMPEMKIYQSYNEMKVNENA